MSQQLTVRLADDLVAFIDRRVSEGAASSRASVVATALDRERRRAVAARDAEILAAAIGEAHPDDLDGLAEFASSVAMPDIA